jgi:hypothetical protein
MRSAIRRSGFERDDQGCPVDGGHEWVRPDIELDLARRIVLAATRGNDGIDAVPRAAGHRLAKQRPDADDVHAGHVLAGILGDHCRDVSHVRQHVERRGAGCGHLLFARRGPVGNGVKRIRSSVR